ncbi:MAG: bifunctional transaldolase/phosoglucose isomerase, partial [Candidatus Limnocylindria bacterium]
MSRFLSGAVDQRLASWEADDVAARLWRKDGSLWAASGKAPGEVAAWLGWLDLPHAMRGRVAELEHLARDVAADGYRRAAVLGMGGSSLAPELFARAFGGLGGGPTGGNAMELRVLDSTHPDAVRGFREWAASARTVFCVSSKSGTTTEPNAFHAAMASVAPALDFLAITDPGTALAELARAQEFRGIVEAPPDVGGRYSALTVFGLVPAALAGVDLGRLLEGAAGMAEECRRPAASNPGLRLGAWMGECALAGRDKLTIITADEVAGLGDWAEQLIAESTGKQGRGIIPVVGEEPAAADAYPDDRAFVLVAAADDASRDWDALARSLEEAGHPVERLELRDPYDLGAEFVRWEVATAAAGIVLGIDPFDQPNVQESKDATRSLLDAYRRDGALPVPAPLVSEPGVTATADAGALGDEPVTVDGALRQLLGTAQAGRDYVAICAYLPPDRFVAERLGTVRHAVRDALGVATTLGFGPRFLHSTGQLHKGGPDAGVFLQLTAEPRKDLPIPGWQESFGTLIAAQALGDLASLQRRGRRVLRLH